MSLAISDGPSRVRWDRPQGTGNDSRPEPCEPSVATIPATSLSAGQHVASTGNMGRYVEGVDHKWPIETAPVMPNVPHRLIPVSMILRARLLGPRKSSKHVLTYPHVWTWKELIARHFGGNKSIYHCILWSPCGCLGSPIGEVVHLFDPTVQLSTHDAMIHWLSMVVFFL